MKLLVDNSAADCSISLRFGVEFDHGTAIILQMFRVKGHRSKWTIATLGSIQDAMQSQLPRFLVFIILIVIDIIA